MQKKFLFDPTLQCFVVLSNLAGPQSWECKRRREPCWVWPVGSWLTAEDSHLTPPVSEKPNSICYDIARVRQRGGESI